MLKFIQENYELYFFREFYVQIMYSLKETEGRWDGWKRVDKSPYGHGIWESDEDDEELYIQSWTIISMIFNTGRLAEEDHLW